VLVVLGGSSPWTAALLPMLERERVVLVGRDRGALEALVAYARQRTSATVTASTDPTAALQKASVVVCQVRFGGWEARYADESQPRLWNAYGDETLGIGGLRGALRASSTIAKWAQIADGVPAIIVTNPTDLITRQWASCSSGMCVSACEVPSMLLQQLMQGARSCRMDVAIGHAGFR
jgi:6-phospho-beta-glucosidase